MDDPLDQPPLPFDPALELVNRQDATAPPREMSFDAFTSLLFEELARRTTAVRERDAR